MLSTKRKKLFYCLILLTLLFTNNEVFAQTITVEQDEKFEQLLNEKRKVNASLTVNDRWKIQIFTGNNENSKKEFINFKITTKFGQKPRHN